MLRPPLRILTSATLAVALALAASAAPARGVEINILLDGGVAPANGTTATTFTFTVRYESSGPLAAAPLNVTATVAGRAVPLQLVSGSTTSGVWQGSTKLPEGTWTVIFAALAPSGNSPTLVGPPCVVVPAPAASVAAPAASVAAPAPAAPAPSVAAPAPVATPAGLPAPPAAAGPARTGTAGGTGNTDDSSDSSSTLDRASEDDSNQDEERAPRAVDSPKGRAAAVGDGRETAERVELMTDGARPSASIAPAPVAAASGTPRPAKAGEAVAAAAVNVTPIPAGGPIDNGAPTAVDGTIDVTALLGWLAVLVLAAIVLGHAALRRRSEP